MLVQYPLDFYPPFASGCGFILSRDLVDCLLAQPLPDYRLLVSSYCEKILKGCTVQLQSLYNSMSHWISLNLQRSYISNKGTLVTQIRM